MTANEIVWGTINGWQYGRNTTVGNTHRGDAFARSCKTGATIWIGCFLGDLDIARDEARERGHCEQLYPNGRPVWDRTK